MPDNEHSLKNLGATMKSIPTWLGARKGILGALAGSAGWFEAEYLQEQFTDLERMSATLDFFEALSAAQDAGSRLVVEWMGDLTIPEVSSIIPLLRPPARKRGRKPGRSRRLAQIDEQVAAKFAGRAPTTREIARERARLQNIPDPSPDQLDNIERDNRRVHPRT